MSSGKDGLFTDNVGPSLYAHAQGRPVKIWGMMANDKLCYFVPGGRTSTWPQRSLRATVGSGYGTTSPGPTAPTCPRGNLRLGASRGALREALGRAWVAPTEEATVSN